MGDYTLKNRVSGYTAEILAAILIIQPFLDVFSYFMQNAGTTSISTGIRFVLLIAVSFYGFFISDEKRSYLLMFLAIGAFWLIHAVNCIRMGYKDPMLDIAEYLKLIQMPLWTLTFITMFKKRDGLNFNAVGILAVNFFIIVLIICLSFATGMPSYTYDYPDRGIQIGLLGWFGVANTQSAIISVLVGPLLLWGYRQEKLWLFCLTSVAGFSLLYFTGTRFAFYSAIIIAAAMIILILINRKNYLYCILLLVCIALLIGFMDFSPMHERRQMATDTHAGYQDRTDTIMGDDKDFIYEKGTEVPDNIKVKIKKVYTDIYGVKGELGNVLLGDLIDTFGVDAVMEKYKYSLDADILYDGRIKKVKCCELIMDSKDFMSLLFGYEYKETYIGDNIYDPENDFPGLTFFYGYIGTGLYLLFILYFVIKAVMAMIKDFNSFLTVEVGIAGLMVILSLAAAQFSGQVLRKPSIVVYISLGLAVIYSHASRPEPRKYDASKKSVVSIRKI